MERFIIFLVWENWALLKWYATQSILQIECNLHKNTGKIFMILGERILGEKSPKILIKVQKTLNSQSNSEQMCNAKGITVLGFKITLYSLSNKSSMILASKLTETTKEQNKGPRNEPTHLQPTDFWQRC